MTAIVEIEIELACYININRSILSKYNILGKINIGRLLEKTLTVVVARTQNGRFIFWSLFSVKE